MRGKNEGEVKGGRGRERGKEEGREGGKKKESCEV